MIVDSINKASVYYNLSPRLEAALKYLQENDLSKLAVGRYKIKGDEIIAIVQEYNTKPAEECFWESHKKYIDVQYVVEGTELMGYANFDAMAIEEDYDKAKDRLILDGDGDFFLVTSGYFAVFFPQDAHMPGVSLEKPEKVRKIVLKVLV